MKTKKLAQLGLFTAIALTIFMVEAQLPALPVAGAKLGLANIVTVFLVFAMGPKEAAMVLTARIFLGSVFAGFSTFIYSAAGGICSILVTLAVRKILTPRQLWVAGALGAVAHSVGQMAAAVAVAKTPALVVWLPLMIAISVVTGTFTGLCAQVLVNRGEKFWKTYFK